MHNHQCANIACQMPRAKRYRHYCELLIFSGKMVLMSPANTWTELLRGRSLRVTRQRLAVLDVIAEHPHLSADAVHAAVSHQLPEITVQSVYTVLHDLTANQLLRRFDPRGLRPAMRRALMIITTTRSALCADASKTSTAPAEKLPALRPQRVWAWRSKRPTSSSEASAEPAPVTAVGSPPESPLPHTNNVLKEVI